MLKFTLQNKRARMNSGVAQTSVGKAGSVSSNNSVGSRDSDLGSTSLEPDSGGSERSDVTPSRTKKSVSFQDRIYVIESPHDSSSGVFSDDHNPNGPEHHSQGSGDSSNTTEHDRPSLYTSQADDIYPPPPPYTGRILPAPKCRVGSYQPLDDNEDISNRRQTATDNCGSPEDSAVSVSDSNSYECGIYNVRLSELVVERVSEDNVGERHKAPSDGHNVSEITTTQRSQMNVLNSCQRPSITRRCETPFVGNYVSGPGSLSQMPAAGQHGSERWVSERCGTPLEDDRILGSHVNSHSSDTPNSAVSRQSCVTPDDGKHVAPSCAIQRGKTFIVSQPGAPPSGTDGHTVAASCGLPGTDSRQAAVQRTSVNCGTECVQSSVCNQGTYVVRGRRGPDSHPSRGDACRRRVPRHRSPSSSSSSCDSSDSSGVGCATRRPPIGWSRNSGVAPTRNVRFNTARKANGLQWAREVDLTQKTIEQRIQPPPRPSRWRQRCASPQETRFIGYRNAPPGNQSTYDDRPPFSRLPDSALTCILSHLNSDQLCRCARVCRRWWSLAWNPAMWRCICIDGATDAKINVDKALKALTRRLSFDTPTVCVMVESIRLSGSVHLTDKGLYTIARRCPELRSLDIHGCADVTNIALFEVVSRCVNLEQLNVAGCDNITCVCLTPEATIQASAYGKQVYLQRLDMSDCVGLDDSGLQLIASFCCQLTNLYVRRCVRVGDLGVQFVANYCPGLRELSISDCPAVTDFGARDLGKLDESLRYLSVAKCTRITDAGIIAIAARCRKMRYLNVRGCEGITDVTLRQLARTNSGLKSLDVGKSDVTDDGLRALAEKCRHLRKLSLKSCARITDVGVSSLAQYCRQLRQLNLQDCQLTVDAYRTVKASCRHCIIEHTNPAFF